MYYSPVPLLVIRADTPALVEVNGHPAGECGSDTHIALPLSDSGDYYVARLPLADSADARLYPVTDVYKRQPLLFPCAGTCNGLACAWISSMLCAFTALPKNASFCYQYTVCLLYTSRCV